MSANKIVVLPKGRLGNQLFQASAALCVKRSMELVFGESPGIFWLNPDSNAVAINSAFGLKMQKVPSSQLEQILPRKTSLIRLWDRGARFAQRRFSKPIPDQPYSKESLAEHISRRGTYLLDGYYQSYNWVEPGLAQASFNMESLLPTGLLEKIQDTRPIVFHVRMTDYLSPAAVASWGVPGSKYYANAYDELSKVVDSLESRELWLASDDLLVAQRIIGKDIPTIPFDATSWQLTPLQKVAAMSLCAGRVLSSSSFSWWAGYLANQGTPTVAPKPITKNGARESVGAPWWRYVSGEYINESAALELQDFTSRSAGS